MTVGSENLIKALKRMLMISLDIMVWRILILNSRRNGYAGFLDYQKESGKKLVKIFRTLFQVVVALIYT